MIKVLTIEGLDCIHACQAFHKLMFGLKMLPAYGGYTYEEFFSMIDAMSEADQEKMIREAIAFVKLENDELMDVVKWACDANGVRYSKENVKSLKPQDIHEILTAVCMVIAKEHRINFVSEDEKKNLKISQSTSEKSSQSTQTSH